MSKFPKIILAQKESRGILLQIAAIFMFNALGYFCNVLANAILTNNLPIATYGDFACAWRSLGLVSQVLIFGTILSANTFIPVYRKKDDVKRKRAFIAWNLRILAKSAIALFLCCGIFWFTIYITGLHASDIGNQLHLTAYVLFFGPLLALTYIINNYFLANGYVSLSMFFDSLGGYFIKLIVITAGFYVFFPAGQTPPLPWLIITLLFTSLVISGLTYGLLPDNELFPSLMTAIQPAEKRDVKDAPEWLTLSKSAVTGTLFATLAATMDIYILEIFSQTESSVAIFNICLLVCGFVRLLLSSMNRIFGAKVTVIGKLSPTELVSFQNSLHVIGALRSIITLLAMYFYAIYASDIFTFFNLPTHADPYLLPIMVFSTFLDNSASLRNTYLMSHDQQSFCLKVQAFRMLSMFVLAITLVQYYDIYGVIMANFTSRLVKLILLTYKSRQLTPIRFNRFF